jgi:hypothetical protein
MADEYQEYGNKAHTHLAREEFTKAGDYYTFSAYSAIGSSEFEATMNLGGGITGLLTAAICYRLAGEENRSKNRCEQGVLIVEDLQEFVFEHDVQIGLTYELTGDFQVIGELGGYEESYDTAREHYVDCENPFGWMGEPEFELPAVFFLRLANSTEYPIDDRTASEIRNTSLTRRVDYKSEHLPDVVRQVVEDGRFEYE